LQSVAAYYEHWNTARLNLPHDRWVVVKLNFALQEQVGFTQKFLAGLALKYAAEEAPHALKTSL